MEPAASVCLSSRELHHLGPLLGVVGDQLSELSRRSWQRDAAEVSETDLQLGIGEPRIDLRIKLSDDLGRRVFGRTKAMGQLVKRLDLPKPLDAAVDKLWGFASDNARHVSEGKEINDAQGELFVSIACAVCTFLSKRTNPQD